MKKVLFITNYASPYRVWFFDELGKYMDVTVLFSDRRELKTHRDQDWFVESQGRFRAVQLKKRLLTLHNSDLCTDVIPWLKQPFDAIVVCGYASPTCMLAMAWMRMHRVPFYMEVDGGLIREDSGPMYRIKRMLIGGASGWISSGRYTTRYLTHYGAREADTFLYPFTSLWEKEILDTVPGDEERNALRKALGLEEEKIVLYVGRFTKPKGMDDLLHAAPCLDGDTGVYFVGGEPSEEHLEFCKEKKLSHVHFVGFKKKEALADYYKAADLLVLPTKSDVWGLVINEAMALGLPVITTDRCVAGLELVENGVNGYIVPVDDQKALEEKILEVLHGDYRQMGRAALEKIRPYTIENMARAHVKIFEGQE